MHYRGQMEGWNIDDNNCHGHCGLCQSCDDRFYQQCDQDYDTWREEELDE